MGVILLRYILLQVVVCMQFFTLQDKIWQERVHHITCEVSTGRCERVK